MSRHLSMNDYYSEGEHVAGHWHGRAAEHLGIAGDEVTKEVFESLASNKHPLSGERLRPRRGQIAYHDFVLSAPKSVSIAAMTGGDQRLVQAYDRCAMRAFKLLESYAACRVRSGESYNTERLRVTSNGVAAVFRHDTSRMLDPQLHTHMVFANLTWDEDSKRWLALQRKVMSEQSAASIRGQFYRELERECQNLGYETDRSGEAFRLSAVSDSADLRLSQRSLQREEFKKRYRDTFDHAPDKKRVEQFIKEGKSAAMKRFREEYEGAFGQSPSGDLVRSFVRDWRSTKMESSTAEAVHQRQRERLGETDYDTLRSHVQRLIAGQQEQWVGENQDRELAKKEETKESLRKKQRRDHTQTDVKQEPREKGRSRHRKRARGVSRANAEAMRRMKRGMSISSALRGHPAGILVRQLTIYAKRQNEGRAVH